MVWNANSRRKAGSRLESRVIKKMIRSNSHYSIEQYYLYAPSVIYDDLEYFVIDNIYRWSRPHPFIDKFLGLIHRTDGPAMICRSVERPDFVEEIYFYYGKVYSSKEEWFAVLTPEEKCEAIWNLNE